MSRITCCQIYHKNRIKAREFLLNTLNKNKGNISKTGRELKYSRNTTKKILRRKISGQSLENQSRQPVFSPDKTPEEIEEKIVKERKKTNFGRKRLAGHLAKRYGIRLSSHTIRNILKRNNLSQQRRKRGKYKAVTFRAEEVFQDVIDKL